jgi:hypothetical protein
MGWEEVTCLDSEPTRTWHFKDEDGKVLETKTVRKGVAPYDSSRRHTCWS